MFYGLELWTLISGSWSEMTICLYAWVYTAEAQSESLFHYWKQLENVDLQYFYPLPKIYDVFEACIFCCDQVIRFGLQY